MFELTVWPMEPKIFWSARAKKTTDTASPMVLILIDDPNDFSLRVSKAARIAAPSEELFIA
jgi:hypothetical protein